MSIWSSIHIESTALDEVPYREEYTGEIMGPHFMVDVATALPWHDKIRVIFEHSREILTRDEARELAERLNLAVDSADRAYPKASE